MSSSSSNDQLLQQKSFIKVRSDLGSNPPGIRPVQFRPVQVRPASVGVTPPRLPPPLIRIGQDTPPPPKLTLGGGGPQVRPLSFVQRGVGSPGNISGVVNIIPLQKKTENGSPKVSSDPKHVTPMVEFPSKVFSKSQENLSSSPPSLTSLKDIDAIPRPSSALEFVKGLKNVTPLEAGGTRFGTNLRPVQVRTMSVCQPSPKSPNVLLRRISSDAPSKDDIKENASEEHADATLLHVKQDVEEEIDDAEEMDETMKKRLMDDPFDLEKSKAANVDTASNGGKAAAEDLIVKKPPLQSRFVRRADGKGFVRRGDVIGVPPLRSSLFKLAKKKKKPFRGCNYRFDGSSIKKRQAKKASASAGTESEGKPSDPASVLSYLGIQKKSPESMVTSSMDSNGTADHVGLGQEPKAKKSFRPHPSLDFGTISRNSSDESSMSSTDSSSSTTRKRGSSVDSSAGSDRPSKRPRKSPDGSKTASSKDPFRASDDSKDDNVLECVCECNIDSAKLTKVPDDCQADHCQAIETVGVNRVGCFNRVVEENFYRRASGHLDQRQFCSLHISRLAAHQACAFCGEFCAHGSFLLCRPLIKSLPHVFHVHCFASDILKRCPHCHSSEKPMHIQLKLSMKKMPISLLGTYAKMSIAKPDPAHPANRDQASTTSKKKKPSVHYTLPNGKVISSEGLPPGIDDSELEKVIKALQDKDLVKHTTRNMLTPTKQGDNVKLLQLLSLGYSVRQKFAEYDGGTLLHVAATEGHVLTAHILIQVGAELDAINNEKLSPMMAACAHGQTNVVKYLLYAGSDIALPGDDGKTCLHLAAQNGHIDCVHAILTHSRLPKKFINTQDDGGWTPLVWACEMKHEEVIRYLLENGADPLICDSEGNIALHWAAISGSVSSCELLLNHGCDVNATNSLGETPMHIILRQDHYECAVLFLMRSARLDIRNSKGLTPAECMPAIKSAKCKMIVQLTSTILDLMKDTKADTSERIVCNDLTRGKESIPIQVVNGLDNAPEPNEYVYITKNCQTSHLPIDRNISTLQHCKCTDDCSSENSCNCADLSIKSWYGPEGYLKEEFFDYQETPTIYECNDMCSCNVATCRNRVLQHGIAIRLQVFRADGMGWGVRAMADIPKGAFVCEYIGELISDSEAETREDTYLFDLDNHGETFCIDANKYGNIARFINHSCSPNLTPVKIFTDHQDLRFPHMALFANRLIPKGEELGFDYGEKFWVIKHKFFTCHCASEKCKYSKSRINSFLVEYYKRIREPMPEDVAERTKDQPSTNGSNGSDSTTLAGRNSRSKDKEENGSTKSEAEASSSRPKRASKPTPDTSKSSDE